jgi:hypothetical protein
MVTSVGGMLQRVIKAAAAPYNPANYEKIQFLLVWGKNLLELGTYHNTYISLTLYPRRGSIGISDVPPRHPRFTKII